ncbi:MAG: EAL domain-containing protein [Clostridiaceae bacterium]|nr:EAL domain-containing protein [Clostridiaceae bacterium]
MMDNDKLAQDFEYDKEHLFEALAESTENYIYVGNLKTGTFRYSPNMVEEFDLPGQIVPDAALFWAEKIHPHDSQVFLEANQEVAGGKAESHSVEYRAKNRSGEWVWLRCRGHMIRDEEGRPNLFAGIITNLDKKNRVDHITGLYNKFEFEKEVRRMIQQYPGVPFGILQLGIDNFKNINNLYDRVFGDEVIRILSQKMSGILPGNAKLYRMDGDEFCIIIKNPAKGIFENIYRKIHEMCQRQQQYNDKRYYCTVSAGGTFYPKDASDYLTLLKFAGYSMEYSKNQGKNRLTIFSDEILERKERDLELLELLREDIENDFKHFALYYQPQVEARTGRIVGAEALVRWKCEKYGNIPPSEFIPLLERSNLILQAGRWIFRQAVLQCREWMKTLPDFLMSINLSYLQVVEADFVNFISEVLRETGVPCENLLLELTETYLIREQNQVNEKFRTIQEMGISVAMDDFGTGYSSLGVLKNTPVDLVKIDQTFVREISNSFDVTFIRFIVALCHDVGKEVCLEGVETGDEYGVVKDIGLEYIQGYYFGRPVPAEIFEKNYL